MHPLRHRFLRSLWAALFLLSVPAGSHANSDPIKIGFVGDFSDVTKKYCLSAYEAAQLAVEEINASGGLLGRPVALIRRDAGVNPERHYEQIASLVREQGVVAVFGGASSACLLRASEAAREQGVPYLISVGNTQSVVVEHGHRFVFLFESNSWMETKGFSIFASLMPWKRYAWIGPDYVWGREVFRYFEHHFREIGSPIQWVTEAWHPLDHRDYAGFISRILAASPDALVIASWGEDMRRFVEQARPYHLFEKMAAFGWFMTEDGGHLLPEGTWTVTRAPFNYLSEKYPQTKAFVSRFKARFAEYPIGFTICSYDALLAWKQAVQRARSAAPDAVAEALRGLSFVGLRGESSIRPVDGQMNCPVFFGRVVYRPEYPSAVLESVIEIPASKIWLSEAEVLGRRRELAASGGASSEGNAGGQDASRPGVPQ